MIFEWDSKKAEINLKKHGVSFLEAADVFADPLSATYDDPDHSLDEQRFITVGSSRAGRLLIVAHTDRDKSVSARETRRRGSEENMKKKNNPEIDDDLRPEYDLSKLEGEARGKYAQRCKEGTNLVLLSPDVAKYFPDEQSVNAALRSLVGIAKTHVRRAK